MSYEGKIVLNYRLTKKLGEGGFGTVYLAEHVELGRRAAIKILHHQFASQPALVERFFREARAVCEIGHRAIVAIENFGRLPETAEPFYLMEFFAGGSLTQIASERWLTTVQLVDILDPIADALAAAHAKGIVHRDLKPDNIMVRLAEDKVADVRLLDFGIAKLLDGDTSHSQTGNAMGTPSFMPPEQALDAKNVDVRADVYAFGATVYAAVAGRPPFDGSSVAAILIAVQTDTAPLLSQLRADVTPELDAAIRRCLAKQRDHRPPTIEAAWAGIRAELVRAALSASPPQPGRAREAVQTPAPLAVATPPIATASDAAPTTPEVRQASRRPWVLGGLGLLLVGGLGLATVSATRSSTTETEPAATEHDASLASLPGDAAATVEITLIDAPLDAPIDAPPDARVEAPIDAGPRRPPDRRPPDRKPPDPEPPSSGCSASALEAIARAPGSTEAQLKGLLPTLNRCVEQRALSQAEARRIKDLVIQRLAS